MTVSMSDTDYAALVEAAGWIRQHAGLDAPLYPKLERLIEVVESIARRRQQPVEDFPSAEPPEEGPTGLHLLPPPPRPGGPGGALSRRSGPPPRPPVPGDGTVWTRS